MNGDRLAIAWELGSRLIEPIVGLSDGYEIVEGEEHEGAFDGLILAGGLEGVLASLQTRAEQGKRGVGIYLMPLATIDLVLGLRLHILACCVQQMDGYLRFLICENLLLQIDRQGHLAIA